MRVTRESIPFRQAFEGKQGVVKLSGLSLGYQHFSAFVGAKPSAMSFMAGHAKGLGIKLGKHGSLRRLQMQTFQMTLGMHRVACSWVLPVHYHLMKACALE